MVCCVPTDRVGAIFAILEQELQAHAEIWLHLCKTQVWNRGGVTPDGVDELQRRASRLKPEAGARGAHWSRRVRACFLGEEKQGTRDSLSADPMVERPSVCVAAPYHVHVDPSKLLVEISGTATRRQRLDVSGHHPRFPFSSRHGQGVCQFECLGGRIGVEQRPQESGKCPLGQLGRLFAHGARPTPGHCGDNNLTVGGGDRHLFRGCPEVSPIG